jgi:hypothetical protein
MALQKDHKFLAMHFKQVKVDEMTAKEFKRNDFLKAQRDSSNYK